MSSRPSFAQISALDRYVRVANEAGRLRRAADAGSPTDPIVVVNVDRASVDEIPALVADAVLRRMPASASPPNARVSS
jgi:hypothetical protein